MDNNEMDALFGAAEGSENAGDGTPQHEDGAHDAQAARSSAMYAPLSSDSEDDGDDGTYHGLNDDGMADVPLQNAAVPSVAEIRAARRQQARAAAGVGDDVEAEDSEEPEGPGDKASPAELEERMRQARRESHKDAALHFYSGMKRVPPLPFKQVYAVEVPEAVLDSNGACLMLYNTDTAKGAAANKMVGMLLAACAGSVAEKKKEKKKAAPKKKKKKGGAAAADSEGEEDSEEDSMVDDRDEDEIDKDDDLDDDDEDDGEEGARAGVAPDIPKGHVLAEVELKDEAGNKKITTVQTRGLHIMLEQLVTESTPPTTAGIRIWIFELTGASSLAAELQKVMGSNKTRKPLPPGGKTATYLEYRAVTGIRDFATLVEQLYSRSKSVTDAISAAAYKLNDPEMTMWDEDNPVNPKKLFGWKEALDRAGQSNTMLCELQRTWPYYCEMLAEADNHPRSVDEGGLAPSIFPLWGLTTFINLEAAEPSVMARTPMPLMRTPRFNCDRRLNSRTLTMSLTAKWRFVSEAHRELSAGTKDDLVAIGRAMDEEDDDAFDPSAVVMEFDRPYTTPTSVAKRIEMQKTIKQDPQGAADDTISEEDVLMGLRCKNLHDRQEAESVHPLFSEQYSRHMKKWTKERLTEMVKVVKENIGQDKMPPSRNDVLAHFFREAESPATFWLEEFTPTANLSPAGNWLIMRTERMARVGHLRAGRMKLLAPQYFVAALQSQKYVPVGELGINYLVEGDAEDGKSYLFRVVREHMDSAQYVTSSFETEKSRTLANCDFVTVYYDEVRPGFFDSDEADIRKEEMTERCLRSTRGTKDTSGTTERFTTQVTVVSRRCTYMINSNCPQRVDKSGRGHANALGTRMISMEDGRCYKNGVPIAYFASDPMRENEIELDPISSACRAPARMQARWLTLVETAIQCGVIPQVSMTSALVLTQNVYDELKREHSNPYPSVRRARQFYEHMRTETILVAIWIVCFSEYADRWRFEGGTASRKGVVRQPSDDLIVEMLMEISRFLVVSENTVANTLMLYETSIVPLIHHRVVMAIREMYDKKKLHVKTRQTLLRGAPNFDHNYLACSGDIDKLGGAICTYMQNQSSGAGKADSVNVSAIMNVLRNMQHQMIDVENRTLIKQKEHEERMRLQSGGGGEGGGGGGGAGHAIYTSSQLVSETEKELQIPALRCERSEVDGKMQTVCIAYELIKPSKKKNANFNDLLFHTIERVFCHCGRKNKQQPQRLVVCDVMHNDDGTTNVEYLRTMDVKFGPMLLEVHNTQPTTSKARGTMMNFSNMATKQISSTTAGRDLFCWDDPVEMCFRMRCARLGVEFHDYMMPHNMTSVILGRRVKTEEASVFYKPCEVIESYPEQWIEDDSDRDRMDRSMRLVLSQLRMAAMAGDAAALTALKNFSKTHPFVQNLYNFASVFNADTVAIEHDATDYHLEMKEAFLAGTDNAEDKSTFSLLDSAQGKVRERLHSFMRFKAPPAGEGEGEERDEGEEDEEVMLEMAARTSNTVKALGEGMRWGGSIAQYDATDVEEMKRLVALVESVGEWGNNTQTSKVMKEKFGVETFIVPRAEPKDADHHDAPPDAELLERAENMEQDFMRGLDAQPDKAQEMNRALAARRSRKRGASPLSSSSSSSSSVHEPPTKQARMTPEEEEALVFAQLQQSALADGEEH